MGKQEDVAAARGLMGTLEKAVAALDRHYPDSVDGRRLRSDSARLREDLDLLCGPASAAPKAAAPPPAPRILIADTPYAHDFWMDAEDEGLGGRAEPGRR